VQDVRRTKNKWSRHDKSTGPKTWRRNAGAVAIVFPADTVVGFRILDDASEGGPLAIDRFGR